MRISVGLSLLLALAVPAYASAGQMSDAQPTASLTGKSQLAMVQPAVLTQPRPVSVHAASPLAAPGRSTSRQTVISDPAALCETAVTSAEYVNRLPARLLGAISLTETGRLEPSTGRLRPWPWTINAEGEGQFFKTKEEAIAAVKALQDRGVVSIDVGCLQVNLMYHSNAFHSLEEAFDPRSNAEYASHFLNALHAGGKIWSDGKGADNSNRPADRGNKNLVGGADWATKDWAFAIAAYHSETPALGEPYRLLVMARWQNADPHALMAASVAYGDFLRGKGYSDQAYGAFAPSSRVYGAFAPR